MKAYKAIIEHGKLYDQETKKRIHIHEGSNFIITIEERFLSSEDPYNVFEDPASPDEILARIKAKEYYRFKKLADRGSEMSFTIKAGKRHEKATQAMECCFKVKLNEELYLIQKSAGDTAGVVFECNCVVEEEITKRLNFFEPVYAYSLNNAYMKTYDSYFSLYGKPTANIYNHFYLHQNKDRLFLADLRTWSLKNEDDDHTESKDLSLFPS